MKNQTSYTTILCAGLAGAGAGLIVGLLMAPKSGEETRSDIGAAVDEYLDSARQTADGLKTSAAGLAQRGLREVQKTKDMVVDKVRSTIDAGEKEAHNAIDGAAASAVDSVDAGARKSHEAVHSAAAATRTGTHG